jgi:hypothetical protein|tara:strand:+ start:1168 stop:1563 length:396 start_codon:yes stop_codon:yes gene_type:complete
MNKNEIEIFEGKTFKDLTKDIYENANNKKQQLDLLVQEIHGFITSIDDIVLIAPIIKELMDVSVKNDEHLVKLASVLQRIITRSQSGGDEDSLALSDQEKEDLIQTLQEAATDIQKESDKITNIESNISRN